MKTLVLIAKIAGVAAMFDLTAVSPKYGVLVFVVASTVKDLAVKIGDWLDDGQQNGSFKA